MPSVDKQDSPQQPPIPPTWGFFFRVIIKAALLFTACNAIFALTTPLNTLGRVSLYNVVLPGRERLPYGENPAQAYNLTLFNLPALFATHAINRDKADDEFRVLFIGDSATWGWRLDNPDTITGQINAGNYTSADGRRIVAYNLAYPSMTLTKDLLLLDYAMRYAPDRIVWPVTLQSFPRTTQFSPSTVQRDTLLLRNPAPVRALIETYGLNLDAADPRFAAPDFWENTIVGQRRYLAALLRLQFYGFSWTSTRIDRYDLAEYEPLQNDFASDTTYLDFAEANPFTENDLAFAVLAAGIQRAGGIPVLIVNEPIYIAGGENSNLHYNGFYPRWGYDLYRQMLTEQARAHHWQLLDVWDIVPPEEFTDTPVHLSPAGMRLYAEAVMPALLAAWTSQQATRTSSEVRLTQK